MIRILILSFILSTFTLFSFAYGQIASDEIECLAKNIYFEARSESIDSKRAIAWVTLNRVVSNKYPNTICDVVYQAKTSNWWKKYNGSDVPVRNQCQFSWYCDGKPDNIYDYIAYQNAESIAWYIIMVYGREYDPTNKATHYHAYYVKPNWGKKEFKTAQIGSHLFYKLP
jgi:spore germination cell wall hydrolase CwlJ-like protein